MAVEAPDARAFKTWEDAFQYPIPVVRKLEQQLRSNADENREKLRSLVGASYRSLLDTAETIIDMETRMEQVEVRLAKVGQNCNTRNLERIANNAVKMDTHKRSREQERYTFTSQLAVLRNCPIVLTRLLKSDGSYLLIAKVLVISRLLHKALTQSKNKPPIVDQLWERLLSVRRKLLRRIDKRLASSKGEWSLLVESMCAYALATSSTPTDVLQHFLKIRLERAVALLRHGHGELAQSGTNALKLCIQTCQDTQTIFPRRLAESLARLKLQPLVQDLEIRALYELNLDIHDRWIGDEARNYTPWPRHDELQRSEAERILHQWSRQAISAFIKGTKLALEKEDRLKEVASLRSELVETWILSGSRMAGVKSANVLDDLRDTMNNHLEGIIRLRAQKLKDVVSELSTMINSPSTPQSSNLSLWGPYPKNADLSSGAENFKSTLLNMHQGRDNSVISIITTFDTWMNSVLEVKGILKSMKEARWDDTFADDVEDSDEDDFGESRQTLLSDDDPRLLEEVTQEALSDALQNLGKSFGQVIERLTSDDKEEMVQKACFLLRIAKEIGERIPNLRLQDRSTPLAAPFTSELLRPLHSALAEQAARFPATLYRKALIASTRARSKSHILWEGTPALPAQPSPSAFRFLQSLNKSMASYGSDLWTSAGVMALKALVCEQLFTIFKDNLEVIEKLGEKQPRQPIGSDGVDDAGKRDEDAETEDEKEASPPSVPKAEDLKSQKLKQALFDMLYIQRFVGNAGGSDGIGKLIEGMEEHALDHTSLARLQKSAADYAKRTYLVFALLA